MQFRASPAIALSRAANSQSGSVLSPKDTREGGEFRQEEDQVPQRRDGREKHFR